MFNTNTNQVMVDTMTQLRLLLCSQCNRSCSKCCNKLYNLKALPIAKSYKDYTFISITGGEPMLFPTRILNTVTNIRKESSSPVVVYTAKTNNIREFKTVLKRVDGITLTIHEQEDVPNFHNLCYSLSNGDIKDKSLRLNIFEDIKIGTVPGYWKAKTISWVDDCPLPSDEVFMRLEVSIKGSILPKIERVI